LHQQISPSSNTLVFNFRFVTDNLFLLLSKFLSAPEHHALKKLVVKHFCEIPDFAEICHVGQLVDEICSFGVWSKLFHCGMHRSPQFVSLCSFVLATKLVSPPSSFCHFSSRAKQLCVRPAAGNENETMLE